MFCSAACLGQSGTLATSGSIVTPSRGVNVGQFSHKQLLSFPWPVMYLHWSTPQSAHILLHRNMFFGGSADGSPASACPGSSAIDGPAAGAGPAGVGSAADEDASSEGPLAAAWAAAGAGMCGPEGSATAAPEWHCFCTCTKCIGGPTLPYFEPFQSALHGLNAHRWTRHTDFTMTAALVEWIICAQPVIPFSFTVFLDQPAPSFHWSS